MTAVFTQMPMNSVLSSARLLLQTRLDDEQRSFAVKIQNSAEDLVTIINDIVEAFNSLASEKLPEAKLKEFVGHTPLQVIAGILLGVANTFIMYYCVL